MSIKSKIDCMLDVLASKPTDIDLSAIACLFSEIRKTIGEDLDRINTNSGSSQPGAAVTSELSDKVSKLESEISSFSKMFSHLKNVTIGKVNIIYKNSTLKEKIVADINSENLSFDAFLRIKDQIDHQFNTSWFPQEKEFVIQKNHVVIPENYKSGGIPWLHA